VELREHQKRAVGDLLSLLESEGVAILEGQQRTGKTLTALAISKGYKTPLLLTKKKAIKDIQSDSKKINAEESLTVINYESAHKLPAYDWDLIILDECHSSGMSPLGKPGLIWRRVRELFKKTGAHGLLMSGTVSIESKAQLFSEFAVTGRGPWQEYRTFYHWWNQPGHYKTAKSGGYGVAGASKRVAGGQEVPDYAQVNNARVEKEANPFIVTVSRADAGFKVTDATQKVVKCANGAILGLCEEIEKNGIVEVDGRVCVYETPAARLQGCHMACGGTLMDENGEGFSLPVEYDPVYKIRKIMEKTEGGKKYVIFAHYIHERKFIRETLGDLVTYELEGFDISSQMFCVLSSTSYSMGVDLSWLTGCQIIYSVPWSGAVWRQLLDRQLKYDRVREAVVGVLLLDGGVDELCYDAVSKKQNFNLSRYRARI
jgi:hypothetical protein